MRIRFIIGEGEICDGAPIKSGLSIRTGGWLVGGIFTLRFGFRLPITASSSQYNRSQIYVQTRAKNDLYIFFSCQFNILSKGLLYSSEKKTQKNSEDSIRRRSLLNPRLVGASILKRKGLDQALVHAVVITNIVDGDKVPAVFMARPSL